MRDVETADIYAPDYVANVFDRCAGKYRVWSAVSSFGFVARWRRQCVKYLPEPASSEAVIVDLMAGTGEIWPYVLRRFPQVKRIVAVDISHQMHLHAVERLHKERAERIEHIEADFLENDLPENMADGLVSSFGLKTFNAAQQRVLAAEIFRILKPGGSFSLVEASDPKGWVLRPFFRFYMDRVLPLVERFFLKGAQDFSMVGPYSRGFGDCSAFAGSLREQGLEVVEIRYFFGCATGVSGRKPV